VGQKLQHLATTSTGVEYDSRVGVMYMLSPKWQRNKREQRRHFADHHISVYRSAGT